MTTAIFIWGACAVLWMITLWWSSRFRRDRDRPSASFTDYLAGGWISLRDILSADFYVADARLVVTVVRVAALTIPLLALGALLFLVLGPGS